MTLQLKYIVSHFQRWIFLNVYLQSKSEVQKQIVLKRANVN